MGWNEIFEREPGNRWDLWKAGRYTHSKCEGPGDANHEVFYQIKFKGKLLVAPTTSGRPRGILQAAHTASTRRRGVNL